MTRTCANCHQPFEANGHWQRLCWPCWRTNQHHQALEDAYTRGYQAALNDQETLNQDTLRDTITLCHPDRHPPERTEQATRVTAQLLALRQHKQEAA